MQWGEVENRCTENGDDRQGMQVSWREIEFEIRISFGGSVIRRFSFFIQEINEVFLQYWIKQDITWKENIPMPTILQNIKQISFSNPSTKYFIISILHLTPSQCFGIGANPLLQHSIIINKSTHRNCMLTPFITIRQIIRTTVNICMNLKRTHNDRELYSKVLLQSNEFLLFRFCCFVTFGWVEALILPSL